MVSWIQVVVASSNTGTKEPLAKILREFGLASLIAVSVSEVRNILLQRTVHVVFCDESLPEGGFREVLGLVKTTKPQVQVVVSSQLGELEEYLEAMNLGAFDFIAPPYRVADILSIIDSACQHYRLKIKAETMAHNSSEVWPWRQAHSYRA
jgi:two-component system, NtrC family, response regulator PilR